MKDKLSIIELQSQPLKGFRRALEAWKGLRVGLKELDKKKSRRLQLNRSSRLQKTSKEETPRAKQVTREQEEEESRHSESSRNLKGVRGWRCGTRARAGHHVFLYGFPLCCLGIAFLTEPEACQRGCLAREPLGSHLSLPDKAGVKAHTIMSVSLCRCWECGRWSSRLQGKYSYPLNHKIYTS